MNGSTPPPVRSCSCSLDRKGCPAAQVAGAIGLDAQATGIFFFGIAQRRLLGFSLSRRDRHAGQAHPRHHDGSGGAGLLARHPNVGSVGMTGKRPPLLPDVVIAFLILAAKATFGARIFRPAAVRGSTYLADRSKRCLKDQIDLAIMAAATMLLFAAVALPTGCRLTRLATQSGGLSCDSISCGGHSPAITPAF